MRALVVAALLLGACETPPMKIVFAVSDGASQSCGSTSCADIELGCDAVISLRILSPDEPNAPYLSVCQPVPPNKNRDLCAISNIELTDMVTDTPVDLPKETLEVQIVIWPRSAVEDPVTGELDCRKFDVDFDAAEGFPISQTPSPAIGGHAYYHPGDELTTVTLGCTDLLALNGPSCQATGIVTASTNVDDFDTGVSVQGAPGLANRLGVAVGAPRDTGIGYVLNPTDTRRLELVVPGPIPVWGGELDEAFATAALCTDVIEDEPQATAVVRCQSILKDGRVDTKGTRLARTSLQQILAALQLTSVPSTGVTIGILLDYYSNPAPGYTIQVPEGVPPVRYLSADRMTLSGAATSASGIFISQDAPFGTRFSANGPQFEVVEAIGGQITGKITVVVLQFTRPGVEG